MSGYVKGFIDGLSDVAALCAKFEGNTPTNEIEQAAQSTLLMLRDAINLKIAHAKALADMASKHQGRANGGTARAAVLSPERRSEIARMAAKARWLKRDLRRGASQ